MVGLLRQLLVPLLVVLTASGAAWDWGEQDKVLLQEVKSLTLYQNEVTNFRRSHPIPQLHCIGGTAGCVANKPQIAQCYNRGWDGKDVLWECKIELEKPYHFGIAELYCEGYDYPDDPYILKGSCGLQYTLELTNGGHGRHQITFGDSFHFTTNFFGVVLLVIFGMLIYFIYKVFNSDCRPKHQRPPRPGSNSGAGRRAASAPSFWTGLISEWLLRTLIIPWRSSIHYLQPPFFNRTAVSNLTSQPPVPPPAFSSPSDATTPSETRSATDNEEETDE